MLELLVQTATGTSNLTSTQATFSNNTVGGNSIIVLIGSTSTTVGDVSGVTDTQGNIYQKAFAVANALLGETEVWYTSGIIGGTTNQITVAYTVALEGAMIAREYYGLISGSALDKQTATTGNSASPSSGGTFSLTQNNELLIGAGFSTLNNTWAAGSGYVNLTTLNALATFSIAMEDQFVVAGGSQSASFGISSAQWACGIATFFLLPTGTTTSTSSTSASTFSTSSTSSSTSSTSSSISSTSTSNSTSSTSVSMSITTVSTSSTSSSTSSTSISSTSSSTSISTTSVSISSTSFSSTSMSSTSSSTSQSSTSSSISSTSSSMSSTSFSTSSTSFSSTSSSTSTSTTTLPPPYLTYSYQDEAVFTTTQQFIKTGIWVCPVNVTSVIAECWGGGGGGGGVATLNSGGGGGAGGGYASSTISVTAGTSYTVTVGTGGAAGSVAGGNGGAGGDSSFSSSATIKGAGGGGGTGNTVSAGGGTIGTNIGTVKFAGGAGGNAGNLASGGGGGGGAGSGGAGGGGGAGGNSVAGVAGSGGGGSYGGPGGIAGVSNTGGASGKILGGGGGGGGQSTVAQSGGAGKDGIVQLTYTNVLLPTTNTSLVTQFNSVQYGNVSTDDGDYFIEKGTQYLIREYKARHPNNTDSIYMAWKGRSTQSTLISPILIQIYNVNSATWETLANQTLVPADTDFQANVSQITNVANYYDSNNIVTFRSYQQVI